MFQTLLAKLARVLVGAGIPYMVIGGQAVMLHGEPRLTGDIDVTLGVDVSDLPRVLELVNRSGFRAVADDVEQFAARTNVLPLSDLSTSVRVNLIFSCTEYEAQAIKRSIPTAVLGTTVRFAAAEDLVIFKLFAGRPRDIEDVRGILSRQKRLDETYVMHWLPAFKDALGRDLVKEYKQIRGEFTVKADPPAM